MKAAVIMEHGELDKVSVVEVLLAKAREAMAKMENGRQFGKIVLKVS
jgi:NADPH:quinone reductase-like Zn-dependent oxidoreductase